MYGVAMANEVKRDGAAWFKQKAIIKFLTKEGATPYLYSLSIETIFRVGYL